MKKKLYKISNVKGLVNELKVNLIEMGFTVLAEVSTSEVLKKNGYTSPFIHQVLFFKPELIDAILKENADFLMLAPLKIIITSDNENEALVRYQSFVETFSEVNSMLKLTEDADLALEFALKCPMHT